MCAYIHIFHQKSLMWVKIKLKQDIQSFDLIHMDHSTWTKSILDIQNDILKGADGSQIIIGKASLYETLSCNTKVHNYKYINNKEDAQYCIFHDINNEEKNTMKNTQRKKKIFNCFKWSDTSKDSIMDLFLSCFNAEICQNIIWLIVSLMIIHNSLLLVVASLFLCLLKSSTINFLKTYKNRNKRWFILAIQEHKTRTIRKVEIISHRISKQQTSCGIPFWPSRPK